MRRCTGKTCNSLASYPGSINGGGGGGGGEIKRSRMHQILHTFRVNRNLQDTCPVYVVSGTSEANALTMVVWVQVAVCGAGVIPPKLKSRLPSKLSSVNTSLVIDLMVTEGMNAVISNACAYV